MKPTCTHQSPLSPAARVALCVGIGTALMVSVNLATGIAVAGGLFIALLPRGGRA